MVKKLYKKMGGGDEIYVVSDNNSPVHEDPEYYELVDPEKSESKKIWDKKHAKFLELTGVSENIFSNMSPFEQEADVWPESGGVYEKDIKGFKKIEPTEGGGDSELSK